MRNLATTEKSAASVQVQRKPAPALNFSSPISGLLLMKDRRKALMQLIGIACPQKYVLLNSLNNWEAWETSRSTPGSREVKTDAHKQDVQGLGAAEQTLQRQLTPTRQKILIMMAHLSHNPTERKLQHSARIDRLLAENGWSADKFHNAVCAWQPQTAELCPADHKVFALHHPLIRSIRAAAIWSHHPFPHHPQVHGGSWFGDKLARLAFAESQGYNGANYLLSPPHLSQPRASQKRC